MTIAIGILMIIAAAAYVAAPFFTGDPCSESGGPKPVTASERQRLERQKLDAYAAIKELEFDYRMHKLSDADFAAIRDKYAAQALEAIAALDAAKAAQPRQAAARPKAAAPAASRSAPAAASRCRRAPSSAPLAAGRSRRSGRVARSEEDRTSR